MFKIGDKVVCKQTPKYTAPVEFDTLRAKMHYIIHDIKTCSCGRVFLNVGTCAKNAKPGQGWKCSACNKLVTSEDINYLYPSTYFEKVIEKKNVVRIEMEQYSYSEN